jgi:hypothetical protein
MFVNRICSHGVTDLCCASARNYSCVHLNNSKVLKVAQFLDAGSLCLTTCDMGRPPKLGTIRPQARRGKKSVVAYLPVPKWKELHIIAVVNEMTIDALVHHGVDLVIEEYKKKRNAI